MGIPGGLFGFVARVIGIQCQRLCQRRKVILGPALSALLLRLVAC